MYFMDEQIEAARIENYSLDDVIGLLLSATPISRAKGQPDFRLDPADSLKAFAFYARNRELWPRSRPVQAKELVRLASELPELVRTATELADYVEQFTNYLSLPSEPTLDLSHKLVTMLSSRSWLPALWIR
jgi:hypothetical protein